MDERLRQARRALLDAGDQAEAVILEVIASLPKEARHLLIARAMLDERVRALEGTQDALWPAMKSEPLDGMLTLVRPLMGDPGDPHGWKVDDEHGRWIGRDPVDPLNEAGGSPA